MTAWRLIARSLAFHRRSHLAVLLGASVGTAILVGALAAGDSVRGSLRQLAKDRLGRTDTAIKADERFFRSRLADDLSRAGAIDAAPVLRARGIAINTDSDLLENKVSVIGVDERFWRIGGLPEPYPRLDEDSAVINDHLAARLNLRDGDEVLLRVERPDLMPMDMPFSARGSAGSVGSGPPGSGKAAGIRAQGTYRGSGGAPTVAVRVRVTETLTDGSFGRFSLMADQAAPLNVFLSLHWLAKELGLEDRANTILLAGPLFGSPVEHPTVTRVSSLLRTLWRLPDAGLELRIVEDGRFIELVSERVFLERPVAEAVLKIGKYPAGEHPKALLTYFVNEIRLGSRSTPYSFVSSPGAPLIPEGFPDDGIVINEWLAEDLGASPGETIRLGYYVPGPGNTLIERYSEFRVMKVIPISGPASDRSLMPNFPGLSGVESCRDWDPGVPIDLARIRGKDERYWNSFKGTPKAFVTLEAARAMWKNRFGDITAVRYPVSGGGPERLAGERASGAAHDHAHEIEREILQNLDPAAIGIEVIPAREAGLQAGTGAVDFGQLFLGLSVFLIASSVMLTSLLFAFHVAHREEETMTLLSVGFSPSRVATILTMEGAFVALVGGALGAMLGLLYSKAILHGLNTVWRDAVGFSSLKVHLNASTVAAGALSGALIAIAAMWLVVRNRHAARTRSWFPDRREARQSLEGNGNDGAIRPNRPWKQAALAGCCAMGASLLLVVLGAPKGTGGAGLFFLSGALTLSGSLASVYALVLKVRSSAAGIAMTFTGLSVRGFARRPKRSLAAAGMLACGIFIVSAVGANRGFETGAEEKREAGTGGFAFYAETTVAVHEDLNHPLARRRHGLAGLENGDVSFVQMGVREGEDASCLNLNRVQNPRILGVRPEELASRKAFSFVKAYGAKSRRDKSAHRVRNSNPWLLLKEQDDSGAVPAIADQTVMTWSLHKRIGETLTYTDEAGRELRLRFVASLEDSIFQGSVLISEEAFVEHFPSTSGNRVFLVDAPKAKEAEVSQGLLRSFRDFGIELVPASARLAEFTKVQNTYLSIFLFLGGLGLVIGSAGSGLVVMRNVLERREELAVLRAVGFTKKAVRGVVYLEHAFMIAAGVVCGAVSALVSVDPMRLDRGTGPSSAFLVAVFAAVVAINFGWTYVATALAMRTQPLSALRRE